jgi:hypothetical protein
MRSYIAERRRGRVYVNLTNPDQFFFIFLTGITGAWRTADALEIFGAPLIVAENFDGNHRQRLAEIYVNPMEHI